jgi:hypothetical protein
LYKNFSFAAIIFIEIMKKLKQLITLLLLSTAFVACKKEETLKDGELKVIVQPYLPDNQVVPGIRVIIYDADAQVMIQDKNLYAKKGEITFDNVPKKSIEVFVRMEYIINNQNKYVSDSYTFTYDGSAKTITLTPR